MKISVVIPVLNEEALLDICLRRLQIMRSRGVEVVVVDGGSGDATVLIADALADVVIAAPRGRASQMDAGADVAHGDVLLFLHADTLVPPNADLEIERELGESAAVWGYFGVAIMPSTMLLRVVAAAMNIRSRLSAIATGDQAIFVRRSAFETIGGYRDIPLMEDIELSKSLKRFGRPLWMRDRVQTSGRRWQKHGVLRTIVLMWQLRLRYYLGADPDGLARQYGYVPRSR